MKDILLGLSILFLLLQFSACSGGRMSETLPEPRPLGSEFMAFRAPVEPVTEESNAPNPGQYVDSINLGDAISLALFNNPELAAFSWEERARAAGHRQAGLPLNPELLVEMENFGGTGAVGGRSTAETTILLSQLLELAGKRSKRSRIAALDHELAGWEYEAKRLDVLTETTVAFIDVLAAQEMVVLAKETHRISGQVFETVAERVKAGKVTPLEETKAAISFSKSRIQMEKEERVLRAARKRLASMWGADSPTFAGVVGDLERLTDVPPATVVEGLAALNPEIAGRITEIERRQAALTFERSLRVPDLSIGGGMRWFEETGDHAFVIGLSLPLPVFDRNQGGIREAEYRLSRAEEELRAVEVAVRTALGEAYEALLSSHAEAMGLKTEVLPAAEHAFQAAREGYRRGKFGFLEVLDAQRTYSEVRWQYIEALAAYHRALAELERLTGRWLSDSNQVSPADEKEAEHGW